MAGSLVTGTDDAVEVLRRKLIERRVVVAIVGPTASGKTAVGLSLARRMGGEIVSADSRQIYRLLDIGTAKPTAAERGEISHHFIDILDPDQEYNAGLYGEQGRATIVEVFRRGNVPIIVGGSGLYIRSLTDGLFDGPASDPDFRTAMEERVSQGEFPLLVEELKRLDPVTSKSIDPTKPRRIIRALEVIHATGRTLSALQEERKPEITFHPFRIGLMMDRADLYRRIDARVDGMLRHGLIEEVEGLKVRGYGRHLNALNTVGYAEVFSRIADEISDDEMVRLIKRNSRRYAKRQMTWFSADKRIVWVPALSPTITDSILDLLAKQVSSQPPSPRST